MQFRIFQVSHIIGRPAGLAGRRRCGLPALLAILLLLLLLPPAPGYAYDDEVTRYLTVPAGSYIIDMGVVPQTQANALKPYGLVYDLLKKQRVPVHWAINPDKAKDGVDFTDPNSGKSFRGGPFIVAESDITPAALAAIDVWKARGVQVDGPTMGPIHHVPIYDSLAGLANIAIDYMNGSIAGKYLAAAGIPAKAFRKAYAANLTACDDIFLMPHAELSWASHGKLLHFVMQGAYLWGGCHAISALENLDQPATPASSPDLNFLSRNGMVPFDSHGNGNPPYLSEYPADPVMQYLGKVDAALQAGSEQVFLPKPGDGWRSGTKLLVYDPKQTDPAISPGPAAAIAYGRGFDNDDYGRVMYQGGHDFYGPAAANIAAQRIFLNFLLLAMIERSPDVTVRASASSVREGESIVLTSHLNPMSAVNYRWSSSGGGVFGSPHAATTTFTLPEVAADATMHIRLLVTDSCGRTGFDLIPITVIDVPRTALVLTKSEPAVLQGPETGIRSPAVQTLGDEPATGTGVGNIRPAGIRYVSVSGDDWSCIYDTGSRKVTCSKITEGQYSQSPPDPEENHPPETRL